MVKKWIVKKLRNLLLKFLFVNTTVIVFLSSFFLAKVYFSSTKHNNEHEMLQK